MQKYANYTHRRIFGLGPKIPVFRQKDVSKVKRRLYIYNLDSPRLKIFIEKLDCDKSTRDGR